MCKSKFLLGLFSAGVFFSSCSSSGIFILGGAGIGAGGYYLYQNGKNLEGYSAKVKFITDQSLKENKMITKSKEVVLYKITADGNEFLTLRKEGSKDAQNVGFEKIKSIQVEEVKEDELKATVVFSDMKIFKVSILHANSKFQAYTSDKHQITTSLSNLLEVQNLHHEKWIENATQF